MRFILWSLLFLLPVSAQAATIADVEAAVMDKDYAQGLALSSAILKQTSDQKMRINVEYYFGLCQLRLGKYAEARTAFAMVMSASLTQDLYEKAALGLIEGLYMGAFYNDALKEGKRLLSRNPNSPSKSLIYLKIARADLKLMKWEDAKQTLNKLIKEYPKSFEAPIAKGLLEEKEFFAVQIGAFQDKDKAMHLVDDLKAKAQYAYIVEIKSADGKKFYRVRVGQMSSLDQAQNVQSQLSHQGYPSLIYP